MKAFICMIEMYDGKKQPMRVFAESKEEARKKLIEQFPQCYVSKAITAKEYVVSKESIEKPKYKENIINVDKLTSNYLWSKIKSYCNYNKIDRAELAMALQVTPTTVSNYSQNADNLKLSSIYNFCRQYEISLSELEQF